MLFVKRCTGQSSGIRARGHHHLFGGDLLRVGAADLNTKAFRSRGHKRSAAMQEGHFVLFKQIQNAFVVLLDHRVFAANHALHIQRNAFDVNAVVCKVVVGLFKML